MQINQNDVEMTNVAIPEESDNERWMKVTFGAVSGILLGGVAGYASRDADESAAVDENEQIERATANSNNGTAIDTAQTPSENGLSATVSPIIHSSAPVAHVSDNMSFAQAFASARSQVGPGGVFSWHGGVYGTYYETEWGAMSDGEKMEYAQSVHTEATPQQYYAHHHSDYLSHHTSIELEHSAVSEHHSSFAREHEAIFEDTEDVHVVGYGTIEGHDAVALDVTGNYEPDVVVVDADRSGSLTDPDVVIDRMGNQTRVGDLIDNAQQEQPSFTSDYHEPVAQSLNPEVAPDMPDYMDDANIAM